MVVRRWAAAAVLMLVGVEAGGCAKNPATGKRQLNLVGKGQEVAMGRQGAEEVVQSIGVYDDADLNRYVNRVGQRLAATSERKDLPWTFQVVDDPSVNAFALPGGFIFVTRGLLAHLENEAQLASVLGHEIGHVTAEHSVNQMSKAQVAQLGLGLGMVLSPTMREMGQVGMQGLSLMFLKFGRDDERQADELGVRYALRAGYDVREMPKVFSVLKRVSETAGSGGGRLPSWLLTHPEPTERIATAEKRLAQLPAAQLTSLTVGGPAYLKQLDGVTFGPDPRDGFFQGDRFFHPEFRFSIALPQGWAKQNLKQAVVSGSPSQDAVIQLTARKSIPNEQAMKAFVTQKGVRQIAPARHVDGDGLMAQFKATTPDGEIEGFVSFLAHETGTFQLLAVTKPERFSTYAAAFAQVADSFRRVTDPKILSVGPVRLQLESTERSAPLAELVRDEPAAVSVEQLALINQMTPSTIVPQGRTLKWAVGGPARSVDVGLAR